MSRLTKDNRTAEFAEMSQLKAEVLQMQARTKAVSSSIEGLVSGRLSSLKDVEKLINSALKRLGQHEMRG